MEGKKGILIAIEGVDGAGKSSQAALLKLALEHEHVPADVIKAKTKAQDKAFDEFVEAFGLKNDSIGYMFAYQALHRRQFEKAAAAMSEGKVVIADRWSASYSVYHNQFGPLSRMPKRFRCEINRLAFEGLKPSKVFFLDLPVDMAFRRRTVRGDEEQFSKEDHTFYEAIRNEYIKFARRSHWILIDGTESMERIHQKIFGVVSGLLSHGEVVR
jgi:dTMP kinase